MSAWWVNTNRASFSDDCSRRSASLGAGLDLHPSARAYIRDIEEGQARYASEGYHAGAGSDEHTHGAIWRPDRLTPPDLAVDKIGGPFGGQRRAYLRDYYREYMRARRNRKDCD